MGLDGYSALQSFFIGRAQTYCMKSKDEEKVARNEFEVNLEIALSEEFQEAFACSTKDPMHSQPFCAKRTL